MTVPAAAPAANPGTPAAQPAGGAKPPVVASNGDEAAAKLAAAAPEPEFEVKIDGQVRKFKKSEAEKLLSKAGYADKAIRQAKEALRATQEAQSKREALLKQAKDDPDAFMKEHGIDPEQFARTFVERKINEGKLTPEQKRIAELEAAQKQRDGELDKFRQDEREKQIAAQAQAFQQRIESQLVESAKRAGIEPGNESFFAIYEAFKEAVELDLPWDPDAIVDVAKQRIDGGFQNLEKAVLNGLNGEALLNRLGPKVVAEVLKARVEQIRGGKTAPVESPTQAQPVEKPTQYMSARDFDKKIKRVA